MRWHRADFRRYWRWKSQQRDGRPQFRAELWALLSGRQAVNDFETVGGGRRLMTSVGDVLTGRGAVMIVLDDPPKADDVLSKHRRS